MNTNPRYFDYPEESFYYPKYMSERDWSDYRHYDYNVGVSSTEFEESTNNKVPNKHGSKFPSKRRLGGPWHRSRRYFKKAYQPAFYSDDGFYPPWLVKNRRPPIQVYATEIGPPGRHLKTRRSSLTLLKRHPSFQQAVPSSYYFDDVRSRSGGSSKIKLAVPSGCRLQLGLRPIELDLNQEQPGGSESRLRRKRGDTRRSSSELSVDISVEMEAITKEIDGIMSSNVLDIMMGQKKIDEKLMELMNSQFSNTESKTPALETLTEEQSKLLATDKPPLEELSKIPLAYLKPRPPKNLTIQPALKTKSGSTQTVGSELAIEDSQEKLYKQLQTEIMSRSLAKITKATNTNRFEGKNSVDTQYDEEDVQDFFPGIDYSLPKLLSRCDDAANVRKIDKNTNWRVQLLNSLSEKEEIGEIHNEESDISFKPSADSSKQSEYKQQTSGILSECSLIQSSRSELRPDATPSMTQPSKTTVTTDLGEPKCFKFTVQSLSLAEVNKLTSLDDDVENHFDGIPLQRALGSIALSDTEFKLRGKNLNCFTEKSHPVECLCEEFRAPTGYCEGGGDSLNNERISNKFTVEQERSDEALTSYLTINDVSDKMNGFTTMDTPVIMANLDKMVQVLQTSTPVLMLEKSEQMSLELHDALKTRTKIIKRLENQIETLESLNR